MSNLFLFAAFPYMALALAVVVGAYRYFFDRYTYSSYSSQFLEKRQLFWGSTQFHYGIILILSAHLLAVLFPKTWAGLLSDQTRLYVLEITGFVLALLVILGLLIFIFRRFSNEKIKTVTSRMDWIILTFLFLQAFSGFYIAVGYRWGGAWYVHTAVPWLWSLLKLNPDVSHIAALPWMVKFHIFNAFLIIALFPFTRLVHLMSVPIGYLWRPYQVVIWNKKR